MEYLKSLFNQRSVVTLGGRSYFPSSMEITRFKDFDVAADVTIKFITMERGKEITLGFTGDPHIVSQTIQDLRED